ncbi:MAG: 30S ribosomal protein S15 [Candidatus Dasytiphilus stammeri]
MSFTKSQIIVKYGKSINDTGCTEVQVALFSHRIEELHKHFAQHKKDYHSQKGLLGIISKRKNLLAYLKRKDINRYTTLIKTLNLRR